MIGAMVYVRSLIDTDSVNDSDSLRLETTNARTKLGVTLGRAQAFLASVRRVFETITTCERAS